MSHTFEKQIPYKGASVDFIFVPLNLSFINVYVVSCTRGGDVCYFHMKHDKQNNQFTIADKHRCPNDLHDLENTLSDTILQFEKDIKKD